LNETGVARGEGDQRCDAGVRGAVPEGEALVSPTGMSVKKDKAQKRTKVTVEQSEKARLKKKKGGEKKIAWERSGRWSTRVADILGEKAERDQGELRWERENAFGKKKRAPTGKEETLRLLLKKNLPSARTDALEEKKEKKDHI